MSTATGGKRTFDRRRSPSSGNSTPSSGVETDAQAAPKRPKSTSSLASDEERLELDDDPEADLPSDSEADAQSIEALDSDGTGASSADGNVSAASGVEAVAAQAGVSAAAKKARYKAKYGHMTNEQALGMYHTL